MSEKQFEEFDDRFREAAEQFEPPFDEASWNKLEPRLDAPAPGRRRAGWWWISDALMLGLLIFIAFQLLSPGNDYAALKEDTAGTSPTQQAITTTDSYKKATEDPQTGTKASNEQKQTGNNTTNEGSIHDNLSRVPPEKHAAAPLQPTRRPGENNRTIRRSGLHPSPTANPVPLDAGADPAGTTMTAVDAPATNNNHQSQLTAGRAGVDNWQESEPPTSAAGITNDQLIVTPEMSIEKMDHSEPNNQESSEKLPASMAGPEKPVKTKNLITQPGFYMYGMLGSEWSLVAGNDAGPATLAWGVGLGYRFSSKWAVQAGYLSTRKTYDAGPGDYKPKPGTYYYNLTIKHVEATCEVTEIPVSVSYTLLNTRRQSLFATLGFSSFIMNSEEYHYDYIRANQQPGYSKYRYSTHNSHLFAGLLLSGGYSHQLFDGLSVSAEPYFKIPLYGVGEGSINIYSFGLMAGARYTLPSFRKK